LVLRSIQLIWTIGCLYTSPFLIVVCPSIWHRKGAPIWMISDLCYGSGDTVINYSYVCWGQSNEGFSVIGSVCLCGSGFRGARIKVDVRMRRTGTCIPWFELLSGPTRLLYRPNDKHVTHSYIWKLFTTGIYILPPSWRILKYKAFNGSKFVPKYKAS
jgi:hypothetical protein